MFLEAFGVCFGDTFLNYRRSTVYQFLGFFQTKTGKFFHELNNTEFACAGALKNYVKSCFLFSSGCACCGTGCYCYCSCCRFDTVLVFENLSKFVYFLY